MFQIQIAVHARQYLRAVFRACVLTRRRYTSDSLPLSIIVYSIDIEPDIEHRHDAPCQTRWNHDIRTLLWFYL